MVLRERLGTMEKQIEADSEAGKVEFLIKEAFDEKAKGRLKEL